MKKRTRKLVLKESIDRLSVGGPESGRQSENNQLMTPQQVERDFQQEEMRNIRQRVLLKRVIKKMQTIIPLNNPPFRINEQWEGNLDSQASRNENDNQIWDQTLTAAYPLLRMLSILQGLSIVLFLWLISVTIVFRLNCFTTAYLVIMTMEVVSIVAKLIIISKNKDKISFQLLIQNKQIFFPFLILVGCTLLLLRPLCSQGIQITIDCLTAILFVFLYRHVSHYFQAIKTYAEQKKVIKELRIIQMFCFLLMIAHVFGLLLYTASRFPPQNQSNWLDAHNLNDKPWQIGYIYSVYWAITTIVTVGYGDLTPQNHIEVLIVMLMQICGTSFFGYMINVIGITVDNINRKNEEYDNYQQTIAKLRDHYQLSGDLCRKMKCDIKAKYNQSKATPLNKNQQIQFLDYVDSTVKKNFILQTNIRIIKKSIFFLTYFSVNFQNQIALKLIRVIYKKDQKLDTYDPIICQRNLVIINHGRVNVFIQRKQNSLSRQKLVKVIQPVQGKHTLNVVGYSGLILNRDLSLFAMAEDLTSGYQLRRSDVLESIGKSMEDYQSFHEMRQKMLLFPMKEAIEAPTLRGPEYHYVPNIFILGRKYNKKHCQTRSKVDRRHNRCDLSLLNRIKTTTTKKKMTVFMDDNIDKNSDRNSDLFNKGKMVYHFQSLLSIDSDEGAIEPILNVLGSMVDTGPSKSGQTFLGLDQVKIFEQFMKLNNVNVVALNYEKSCKNKTYKKRMMTKCIVKSIVHLPPTPQENNQKKSESPQ